MNPSAKEYLDKILEKSPESLNELEVKFLRARRSYLKPSQLEEYKEVLEVKEEVKVEEPKEVKEEVKASESDAPESEASESDEALKAFQEEATKLEVVFDKNTTKDELIQLIKDKKAK